MSTTYYLVEKAPCSCCGREYGEVEIGTSGFGWRFVVDGTFVSSWAEMKTMILNAHRVYDEYRSELTAEKMIETVEGSQVGTRHSDEYPDHFMVDGEGYEVSKP